MTQRNTDICSLNTLPRSAEQFYKHKLQCLAREKTGAQLNINFKGKLHKIDYTDHNKFNIKIFLNPLPRRAESIIKVVLVVLKL